MRLFECLNIGASPIFCHLRTPPVHVQRTTTALFLRDYHVDTSQFQKVDGMVIGIGVKGVHHASDK